MMKKNKLSEGLQYEELRGLISSKLSIDQYKPKIGGENETCVVAFTVTYEEPAQDLSNYIETGDLDHLDIEPSSSPEPDGSYRVFVEFQRDLKLFEKINLMLENINQIVGLEKNWRYIAWRKKDEVRQFTEENFKEDIILSASEYKRKYMPDNEQK